LPPRTSRVESIGRQPEQRYEPKVPAEDLLGDPDTSVAIFLSTCKESFAGAFYVIGLKKIL
jgi:hypothetical protein